LYKGEITAFQLPLLDKPIYLEGIVFGASMGLRISWMVVAAFVFLAATDQRDQILGLVKLGLPYSIGLATAIAFRYVPTIVSTLDMIKDAQKARCLNFDQGSLWSRIKRHAPIMLPLFITSVRSAIDLSLALESRGYGSEQPRTSIRILELNKFDWAMITFGITLAVAALLLLTFYGVGNFPL
jgi:energy-coupling factor transport system permease protein